MSNILINQSLQIKVDTNIDVTGATLTRIDYLKPDGITTGSFTTGITVEGTKVLVYNIPKNILDVAGGWKFHSYVESGADAWTGDVDTIIVTNIFS